MDARVNLDLNDVSLLVRVVQTRSFTAAARERGVPVSTVSRRIARLESALGIRQIAYDSCPLRHFAVTGGLQGRRMAERIAAIVQGDETVTLSSVEPLDLARRGSLREGLGPFVVIMSHLNRRHTQAG